MKKMLLVLVTCLVLVGLCACGFSGSQLAQTEDTLEAGQTYNFADMIRWKGTANVSISEEDNQIDISTPGEYPVTFAITNQEGETVTQTMTFKVVDTTGPQIIPDEECIAQVGEEVDPSRFVDVQDAGDPAPQLTWDLADANFNDFGTAVIHYTATDASGNETKLDVTVTVDNVFTKTEELFIEAIGFIQAKHPGAVATAALVQEDTMEKVTLCVTCTGVDPAGPANFYFTVTSGTIDAAELDNEEFQKSTGLMYGKVYEVQEENIEKINQGVNA